MAQDQQSMTEQLAHSTVKIDIKTHDNKIGNGTGFFFRLCETDSSHVPIIITNKHVIKNSVEGTFYLSLKDENGNPIDGKYQTVVLPNFKQMWKLHPDPNVDLAAMPIAPLINAANTRNINFYYISLDKSLIMSDKELDDLNYVENILMIGYPNGLWDIKNNLPIIREGITATHPGKNYNSKEEFIIDAACFPGSSGSPVFLYNAPYYMDKKGNTIFLRRIKLLGILWGGPQHKANGEIKVVEIPMKNVPISQTSIPNNLGYVIKASQLLEFETLFCN